MSARSADMRGVCRSHPCCLDCVAAAAVECLLKTHFEIHPIQSRLACVPWAESWFFAWNP